MPRQAQPIANRGKRGVWLSGWRRTTSISSNNYQLVKGNDGTGLAQRRERGNIIKREGRYRHGSNGQVTFFHKTVTRESYKMMPAAFSSLKRIGIQRSGAHERGNLSVIC